MRTWPSTSLLLVLGLSSAVQLARAAGGVVLGITDIKITTCPEDNCRVPGYRKISQDLNKYSRGSFVHLHFTDNEYPNNDSLDNNMDDFLPGENEDDDESETYPRSRFHRGQRHPITHIAVQQGQDPEMGPEWEALEGNLNEGNRGPTLTMFVKRDPDHYPIDSIVVKYGYDSHAAIGYDRLPMDLNTGTGGQWVYLYYKRSGPREPITQIATKACTIPPCNLDESWTRVNRPIMTGTLKRYLYLFYKSVPGERPITSVSLGLERSEEDDEDMDKEIIDTGVRFKNNNVFLNIKRGQHDDRAHGLDSLAVELGTNQVPYHWTVADFERKEEGVEVPDWNVQVIYRTGYRALPRVPKLRFQEDGSFKIVQFADIHMATGPHSCHNVPSTMECTGDVNTLEMMERMLDAERPDLVVYTGDNVDGLTSNDAYATILKYSKPVVDRGIPWTIIFGNHDEEGDLSREEMMRSVQDIPYSLSERGPLGISGTGNYVLNIHKHRRRHGSLLDEYMIKEELLDFEDLKHRRDDDRSQFTLYFVDSGAYSFSIEYPGWDWIKEDQVEWFRQTSKEITSRYQIDQIPNALAFFHIPIPEYDLTDPEHEPEEGDNDDEGDDGGDGRDGDEDLKKKKKKNDKNKKGDRVVGDKGERVSTPSYNSGMFEAIFETKDVRATTAGHDHLNDYCLDHRGINLCYGGGLGYGSYGSASVPRRSRVFEIRKNGLQ
ncbi:purple acid phosphatase, partial [Gryganskiella cystojenkinii]